MARLKSIIVICTIICCLHQPIHAFNDTRSFHALTETEYVFVSSKDRVFAVSLEKNILLFIAVDGGNESNMCYLLSSPIEMSSNRKQLKTLGNGKLVISAETGKEEHLGGKVHSFIIVDPLDCSSLVEFKAFGGVVVPYQDSFDIIHWSYMLKPQRRNDRGKLIRLEKRFNQRINSDQYTNVQAIKLFDDSEGYYSESERKLRKLDPQLEQERHYPLNYVEEKISIDYGRATVCHRTSEKGLVCDLLDKYLNVRTTVGLNELPKARFHTVNNLPDGRAIVVRSTHIPDIETFRGTIINADGSIGMTEAIMGQTIHEAKVHAFVLSSGEFCIVVFGKNSNEGRLFTSAPSRTVLSQCIDIGN